MFNDYYLQFWETKSCLKVASVVYYIICLNVESVKQPKLKKLHITYTALYETRGRCGTSVH